MGKCLGEIQLGERAKQWYLTGLRAGFTVTTLQDGTGSTINKVSDEASLGGLKGTQRLGKYFQITLTNRNTESDRKGPQEMLAL